MTSTNWPAEVERLRALERQKQTRDEREELLASIQPHEIVAAVCALTRVTLGDLFGLGRAVQVTAARRIAVGLMRDLPRTPVAFPAIAAALGRTSHSTTMHQYEAWLRTGEHERNNWIQWAFHWIREQRKENNG